MFVKLCHKPLWILYLVVSCSNHLVIVYQRLYLKVQVTSNMRLEQLEEECVWCKLVEHDSDELPGHTATVAWHKHVRVCLPRVHHIR